MIKTILITMTLVFSLSPEQIASFEQAEVEAPIVNEVTEDQRDNGAFILLDELLQKYVSAEGVVNYKGLKGDPSFARCITIFENMAPEDSWSKPKEMAFWINTYNVFTLQLILDNYPLKSITDIKEPWDKKFISLKGKKYSLNQIENEILRPKFKDPRIHFAINCASVSCPRLSTRAFFDMSLDRMLDQMTKEFLKDDTRNKIGPDKYEVSQIFEWFAADFDAAGGVIKFINRYSKTKIPSGASISYLEYDWGLNGK
jgi:hypothetical protein